MYLLFTDFGSLETRTTKNDQHFPKVNQNRYMQVKIGDSIIKRKDLACPSSNIMARSLLQRMHLFVDFINSGDETIG
jgi:hypothetical protein